MKRAAIALWLWASVAAGADYYAAPNGSGVNCTFIAPCSFDTGLSKLASGDTLWMRGGTYGGIHVLDHNGATVRAYNATFPYGEGERVTIDPVTGGGSDKALLIKANNLNVYDLEILWSWPGTRSSAQTGSNPTDLPFGYGFDCFYTTTNPPCQNVKLVNVKVHDTRGNGGSLNAAQNFEVADSLLYYQGWNAPDRQHGHNLYIQAVTGPIKLTRSLVFYASENNIQGFGSAASALNNFDIEDIASISQSIVLGGTPVLNNLTYKNNVTYQTYLNLGYCDNGGGIGGTSVVSGNYMAGFNSGICLWPPTTALSMTGNSFYLAFLHNTTTGAWPGNTWVVGPYPNGPVMTTNAVFVKKSTYIPGRAMVWAYNWQNLPTVPVDLSGVLAVGESYEIRNAQNFYGPLIATGTYTGAAVAVPAGPLSMVQPLGKPAAAATGPNFNAYVVIRTGPAQAASPTPTRTATLTATVPPTATATRTPTLTNTATKTNTPTVTRTPTPASVCVTVTPACVMVTVTP